MTRSRYWRTRPKPSRRHPLYRSCKPSEYVSHWCAAALTKPCHKPVPLAPEAGADHIEENLARLEVYLAAWRCAQQTSDAAGTAKWEQAAVAQARAIGQAHPAATARRAETMLARSIVQSGGSEGPRATLLAAQSLYRAGRLDEALAAFDKAAHRAAAIEDSSATFDAHYSAAALEQERGNHAEALARFLKIRAGHARQSSRRRRPLVGNSQRRASWLAAKPRLSSMSTGSCFANIWPAGPMRKQRRKPGAGGVDWPSSRAPGKRRLRHWHTWRRAIRNMPKRSRRQAAVTWRRWRKCAAAATPTICSRATRSPTFRK